MGSPKSHRVTEGMPVILAASAPPLVACSSLVRAPWQRNVLRDFSVLDVFLDKSFYGFCQLLSPCCLELVSLLYVLVLEFQNSVARPSWLQELGARAPPRAGSVCPAGPPPPETAQLWLPGPRTPGRWAYEAQPGLGHSCPHPDGLRGSRQGPRRTLFASLPTLSSAGTALPKFPPTQPVFVSCSSCFGRGDLLSFLSHLKQG